jgi:hypothetical protein
MDLPDSTLSGLLSLSQGLKIKRFTCCSPQFAIILVESVFVSFLKIEPSATYTVIKIDKLGEVMLAITMVVWQLYARRPSLPQRLH